MAPLRPAPEMESKETSDRQPVARRKPSSASVGCDLGQLAVGRLAREPGQEARQRRAVADMGLARAFDFQADSCRPWAVGRDRRAADHLAPAWSSRSKMAERRWTGSTSTCLAFSASSAAVKSLPAHAPARHCPDAPPIRGCAFLRSRNRSALPSSCRMAKASANGVCGTSLATDIEQPADGIRQSDHRRVGAGFLQRLRPAAARLALLCFARKVERHAAPLRPWAASARSVHTASIGLLCTGDQAAAGLFHRMAHRCATHWPVVQPRVIAQLGALAAGCRGSSLAGLPPPGRAARTARCRSAARTCSV